MNIFFKLTICSYTKKTSIIIAIYIRYTIIYIYISLFFIYGMATDFFVVVVFIILIHTHNNCLIGISPCKYTMLIKSNVSNIMIINWMGQYSFFFYKIADIISLHLIIQYNFTTHSIYTKYVLFLFIYFY